MRLNYIDNCDCLEGLREVPDNSVDLIVTDPPYFLSMGHAGSSTNARGGTSEQLNTNRCFNDLAICTPFYKQLFAEYKRVLKDDGSFYFFTDWRGYAYYFPLLNAELPVRNMLVWDKKSGPGSFYGFAHELIIFGTYKPKNKAGCGTNVWRMSGFNSGAKSTNGDKVHPTQKPWEVIAKAIEDSTEPGAVVLDTFMGSGTTAVACLRTGRNYIGFELDEKYHAIAEQRIAGAVDELLGV
ncbi:MAG: site-specific DNA-methyltransferase [Alistipes sp.]|nr:site-specific DNA-methyltransferase [Alistipes sp.]